MSIQEKQVVVHELLTTYYYSEGKGKPLVFLHGWGSNSTFWFKAIDKIVGAGYRLYFLDMPGFGKTEMPQDAFTTQKYAEFVTAFIDKLGIDDYVLIGHSFGGKVAVKIASTHTDSRLSGLVLVDASGLPHTSVLTKLKAKAAHTLRPLFTPRIMQSARNKLLRFFGSDDYVAVPQLRQTFINIIQEHITFDLPKIKSPTLIVWGAEDDNEYSPPEDAHIFHKHIHNSQLCMIDGAKHYSFMDKPVDFQKVIIEFVTQVYGKN